MAIVMLAVVLCPRAGQAQWKKQIDWLFRCTALLEAKFGQDSLLCDDVHGQGGIKATLDEASFLLESLHFASPAISANLDLGLHMEDASAGWQALQIANERDPRCEVRYCAWLVYGLGGNHGAYSWVDRSLVLDPFRTNDAGELESGWDDGFGLTEVHELFHAVQFGYPGVLKADTTAYLGWIIEGTAEHVMRALGRPMGLSPAGTTHFRTYNQSLHSPPTDDPDDPAFTTWAYGAWEFFDFVGDYLGSDLGIQYLDHLFKALRSNQNNGLEAVEAAVRHEAGKGLYEVFPEFVARRLVYPCYFSALGTWRDGGCLDGPDNEHRFELTFPDTVRLDHTAAALATNGYLVRTVVPEGKQALLTIRVPADNDEEPLKYLHLIVDDERWDTPAMDDRRNEYMTILSTGPHEFLVRLANVPRKLPDAAPEPGLDSSTHDPAPIEFILVELDAQITVSSPAGGGSFDPTRWWFGVHTSDEIAAATPASQSLPPGNACQVQLTLAADDVVGEENVSVILMGWVPDPLAPGAWPVGEYQSQNRLGEVYADVVVPCQFGGCVPSGPSKGHKYRMVGFHGELEFTDVSRSHVAGRFDITADAGEPYAGVGLSGIYSVTLGGPADVGEKTLRADHPCAPPPPDSKPDAPGGNGANPVGDAPGDEPADDDGDPGADGEEDAPPGADGAPGEADPGAEAGAPGEAAGAGDQEADEAPPEANPEAQGGELRASELILGFPQDGRSVLRSEPQAVQGTGSVTGVALASRTYDLTVALPVFGCTVEMGDVPAAEQFQLALAHDRWLKSGRTVQGFVLFDFTAAELRLDAASGGVTLDLESAEGGVTIRGTADNAVSLRSGGAATIVGNVSDATLEVTRGDDTFRCAEPMDFSFTVAGMD